MSRTMKAIQAYCDGTGASPFEPYQWPPFAEMVASIALGDRLGWTDEQMREVDGETHNR